MLAKSMVYKPFGEFDMYLPSGTTLHGCRRSSIKGKQLKRGAVVRCRTLISFNISYDVIDLRFLEGQW